MTVAKQSGLLALLKLSKQCFWEDDQLNKKQTDMLMHTILYSCYGDAVVVRHVVLMKEQHLFFECTLGRLVSIISLYYKNLEFRESKA